MFLSLVVPLLCSFVSPHTAHAQIPNDLLTSLRASLSPQAVVLTPDDAAFQNASARWSLGPSPSFVAVVEVAEARDVQVTVRPFNLHVRKEHLLSEVLVTGSISKYPFPALSRRE